MKVTIRDIAGTLSLSHTTVSRVLNNRQDFAIPPATRERVRRAARDMGYRPNRAARALVTGRSGLVALGMNGVASTFYMHVARCFSAQARVHDYQVLASDLTSGGARVGRDDLSGITSWPCDGIVAVDPLVDLAGHVRDRQLYHVPFVSIGSTTFADADHVAIDLYSGTREAVEHLLARGCRRVALVTGKEDNSDDRHRSFTAAMAAVGRPAEYVRFPSGDYADVAGALQGCAASSPDGCPDGLFCFNDDVAIAAYRAVRDLGLRVPEDVAIVGCDGNDVTRYLERPLTTLIQPVEEMCALAWQFLQRRIADPSTPPQTAVLRPRLEVRGSTVQ